VSAEALTGWGHTRRSVAEVVTARDEGHLAELVLAAPARGVLARGLGRSYGDAAQNGGGVVVAPFRPDEPPHIDVELATVRAAAGMSLARLLACTLPHGLMPPVLPGTRYVTLAGAVAADVHGKNHHVDGSFGAWVQELVLIDGTGRRRVVGPTRDPEVFWATFGGMGLTGIVTEVTMRLLAVPTSRMRVATCRVPNLDALFSRMKEPIRPRYDVAWVDCLGAGRSVLDEGEHATVAELRPADRGDPLRYRPRQPLGMPALPFTPLRPATVRAFNEAWWRHAPASAEHVVGLSRFFHPLDGVGGWNRLYGPRGFLQYQLVVPEGAEDIIGGCVRDLGRQGLAPFLAVLKRFGPASAGPLSFPASGWTFAVDLPVGHPDLPRALDRLDGSVAAAGGRVYLAKDARLRADVLASMYPRLPEWRVVRDRLDPDRRFRSDLGRRLNLS